MGIDPGTGRCGFALVNFAATQPKVIDYGVFEYASTMTLNDRFVLLDRDINRLFETYHPEALAIETLIFNRNITTAMQVSEARGVILLAGAKRKVPIQNCTPLQVKMTITGYGRADKSQVKQMVAQELKLTNLHKLDDAIDALAIAITGYHLLKNREKAIQ